MQFHIERCTGILSRTIYRESRSITVIRTDAFVIVIPNSFEVLLVSGVFAAKLSRIEIRKTMNREESAASGRAVDSLINYETYSVPRGKK